MPDGLQELVAEIAHKGGTPLVVAVDREIVGVVSLKDVVTQADVGLAMQSGTSAAKEAANLVDVDSDPTKILELVDGCGRRCPTPSWTGPPRSASSTSTRTRSSSGSAKEARR